MLIDLRKIVILEENLSYFQLPRIILAHTARLSAALLIGAYIRTTVDEAKCISWMELMPHHIPKYTWYLLT
jgi:hypothetical protein